MISLDTSPPEGARIRVIGVGGGGGNAINNMITRGLEGVDFIAANTDKQALDHNLAQKTIQVGSETTRGLGAGADPEIGRYSVEESSEEIESTLKGSDMIFVTGGMGGGTGTGGAPVIAKIGQELGALVVGIVTKPFIWEGRKRMNVADKGIEELRQWVDALIVIPNQKLLDIIDKNTSFGEAFQKVDEVLYNATKGIADIISRHGVVNVDFADVKTVMKGMGDAIMGIGTAEGEHRSTEATQNALNSPLLDGTSISGAQGVLVNISGGSDMTMHEVAEAVSIVEKAAGENANLIHGVVYNTEPSEEIMVTVVATGFKKHEIKPIGTEEGELEAAVVENGGQLSFIETYPRTNPMERHFTNSPLGLDTKNKIPLKKNAVSTYRKTEFISSPKGFGQLKKYDRPAYERRGDDTFNGMSPKETENNDPEGEFNKVDNGFSKPEFLKRIMD